MRKKLAQRKAHVRRRQRYQAKQKKKRRVTRPAFFTPSSQYRLKPEALPAPKTFNLHFENCVKSIKYVNLIKKNVNARRNIVVDLSEVEDIGEGAIAMLLSVMNEAKKRNVSITGNIPTNLKAKTILEKSGFFKFVNRRTRQASVNSKNMMRTGKRGTSHVFLAEEVRKAMGTVWGEEGRNPLVHTIAFEMMRNSCDHAFPEDESTWWHLSISHDEDNHLVKFSFVDNGKGIIGTLRRKGLSNFLDKFRNAGDILDTAFQGKIESRTGLSWRGKGLPTIFENYAENTVKNFLVISNNAFIHYDRKIREELPISYQGTYYYWEVDTSCKRECYL